MNASVFPGPPIDRLREQLDAKFRAALMAYFMKRVHDRSEAEDLTQEVFVRLIAQAQPLNLDTAEAYVFTVAANLLRDRARRGATHKQNAHDSLDEHETQKLDGSLIEQRGPERVLLGREHLNKALEALNELDARTRHVFVLFRIERLRLRDIAELYGLSMSAVERLVTKASTHLVKRLGQDITNRVEP